MDKLKSRLFSTPFTQFEFLNFGYQPKLFVDVPKQTNIRGKFSYLK